MVAEQRGIGKMIGLDTPTTRALPTSGWEVRNSLDLSLAEIVASVEIGLAAGGYLAVSGNTADDPVRQRSLERAWHIFSLHGKTIYLARSSQ